MVALHFEFCVLWKGFSTEEGKRQHPVGSKGLEMALSSFPPSSSPSAPTWKPNHSCIALQLCTVTTTCPTLAAANPTHYSSFPIPLIPSRNKMLIRRAARLFIARAIHYPMAFVGFITHHMFMNFQRELRAENAEMNREHSDLSNRNPRRAL